LISRICPYVVGTLSRLRGRVIFVLRGRCPHTGRPCLSGPPGS
jgi:hypothetical protein